MTVFIVDSTPPIRLDVYLAAETDLTRSQIKQLIDGGHILLNGKSVKSGKLLTGGEEITLQIPDRTTDLVPQDIPLDILFEDEHIAVVNKQSNLSVHPAGGAVTDTLVNALLFRFDSLSKGGEAARPGIVHRLDKDTTGVMVVAKTDAAHLNLSRQFAERSVKKLYHAIAEGVVKEDSGAIDAPIGRSRADRKKMAVTGDGRCALTFFRVLERFCENTLVEFDLKTGRTHQIRVHCKHIGHPIVGDNAYGFKKQRFSSLKGQLLHSYYLQFSHPVSGQALEFTAPYPDDFDRILKILRNENK